MLEVSPAGWTVTIAVIVELLALDLVVSARRPRAAAARAGALWSVFYIATALGFGIVFGAIAGWDFGAQYFAGYMVEKSLSVDNLFVFVVITGSSPPRRRSTG